MALANEGIWTIDSNNITDYVNERGVEILGYAPEEMIGRKVDEFRFPGTRPVVLEQMNIEGRGEPASFELKVPRKDGSEIWALIHASSFRDPQGRYEGGVALFSDITDRKRVEEDLVRSNDELQQFAYVASHDLQESLRVIIGHLMRLDERAKAKLDEREKEHLWYSVEGAARMKKLIDDLLSYSRVESQPREFTKVDMNDVLTRSLRDLRAGIAESGAEITSGVLPEVVADKGQMVQLFDNLIGNAIKYRSDAPPQIDVSAIQGDRAWVFAVRDNGIGIDPRQRDHVFKMFQRLHTKDEYPGTGIGLAISKRIVERHGGRIWVESSLGEGAAFLFTIPLEPPFPQRPM